MLETLELTMEPQLQHKRTKVSESFKKHINDKNSYFPETLVPSNQLQWKKKRK